MIWVAVVFYVLGGCLWWWYLAPMVDTEHGPLTSDQAAISAPVWPLLAAFLCGYHAFDTVRREVRGA